MVRRFVILIVLASLVLSVASDAPKEITKVLYFSHFTLPPGKRIAALRIELYGARVSALPKIPADWHMSVELDGSYMTKISGNCQHGVGGLVNVRELDGIIAGSTDNWSEVKVKGVICITTDFEHLDEVRVNNHMIEFRVPNKPMQPTPR